MIGGTNVDLKSRTRDRAVLGTSNPGSTRLTWGGVARNVAENLARLGARAILISAVGTDPLGGQLVRETGLAGVDVSHVTQNGRDTGMYTAILDVDGELVAGVAAMTAVESISPDSIESHAEIIACAQIVVADCNLAAPTLARVITLCERLGVRLIVDPVSAPKAARLSEALAAGGKVHTVTPTLDELGSLTPHAEADRANAAASLRRLGIEITWLRLGASGSVLLSDRATYQLPALQTGEVADVTGAGECDALRPTAFAGSQGGASVLEAARYGHAAAAITVIFCPKR